jgi:hypothetical protein
MNSGIFSSLLCYDALKISKFPGLFENCKGNFWCALCNFLCAFFVFHRGLPCSSRAWCNIPIQSPHTDLSASETTPNIEFCSQGCHTATILDSGCVDGEMLGELWTPSSQGQVVLGAPWVGDRVRGSAFPQLEAGSPTSSLSHSSTGYLWGWRFRKGSEVMKQSWDSWERVIA